MIIGIEAQGQRHLGIDEGRFDVPEDFDSALPEDVLQDFEGLNPPAPRRS